MEPTEVANGAHWDIVIFFVSQSIIIIGAIVAAYVRTQVAITRLSAMQQAHMISNEEAHEVLKEATKSLKSDHGNLGREVSAVGRSLARLEGHVNAIHPFKSIDDS